MVWFFGVVVVGIRICVVVIWWDCWEFVVVIV